MTRDEAKKAAEEYADSRWGTKEQARKLAVEWGPQMYDCERQETVRAYMACYDMMVSGEPDGWTVESEILGVDVDSVTSDRSSLEADFEDSDNYKIVPVKLIKCEEK